jgi:hypothetical protein
MEEITDDRWITRQELADRYGVPVKTPAEWASKGTGPVCQVRPSRPVSLA